MMSVLKLLLVLIQFTNSLQYIEVNLQIDKSTINCDKSMTLHIKNKIN